MRIVLFTDYHGTVAVAAEETAEAAYRVRCRSSGGTGAMTAAMAAARVEVLVWPRGGGNGAVALIVLRGDVSVVGTTSDVQVVHRPLDLVERGMKY